MILAIHVFYSLIKNFVLILFSNINYLFTQILMIIMENEQEFLILAYPVFI